MEKAIFKSLVTRELPENYYEILGVSENASFDEIKRAFRRLSLKYHPDKNRENIEEFTAIYQKIVEAYIVLSDPRKRKEYDDYLKYGKNYANFKNFFKDIFDIREFAWVVSILKYYDIIVKKATVGGTGVGLIAGAKIGWDSGGLLGAIIGGVIGGAVGTIGGNIAGEVVKKNQTKELVKQINDKIIEYFSQKKEGYILSQYILSKYYSKNNLKFPIANLNVEKAKEKEPLIELILEYLNQFKNFNPYFFQQKAEAIKLLNFAKQYEKQIFIENKVNEQIKLMNELAQIKSEIEKYTNKMSALWVYIFLGFIAFAIFLIAIIVEDCRESGGLIWGTIFGLIPAIIFGILISKFNISKLRKMIHKLDKRKKEFEKKLENF